MNIEDQDWKAIKGLQWWTAEKRTPYIVKGGVTNEEYHLLISDLKSAWYRKGDKKLILKEKAKYNEALQVNGIQGILELLAKPISSLDKKANYTFTQMRNDDGLIFEFSTIITIYPFKWQFYCNKLSQEQFFNILTEDLVNPLICSLKTMETRIDLIKKQYYELERDYIKKLSDKERTMYKAKLDDTEDTWRYLIKENPIDAKICDFDLNESSTYFFTAYSMQRLKKKEEIENQIQKERQEKESKKRKADMITSSPKNDIPKTQMNPTFADEYIENIEEINKKIELDNKIKKQVENKAKKAKRTFL